MRSTALPCGLSRGWIRVSASGVGAHFGLRGVTSGSQCIQGDMAIPSGVYGVVFAFGAGDPGLMPRSRIIPQTVHTHVRSDRGSPATGLDEWE